MSSKSKGAGLIILSSFFFALMSAFVSMAGELPFYQKALFRNAVAALVSALILLRGRTLLRVPAPCRLPLLGRVVGGMIGVFCNYYAIDHMQLASSNSLNKLSPFFAILFAAAILKERVDRTQAVCVLLALTGSLFLIVPNLGTVGLASCIALLGAIGSGAAHTSLRAIRRSGEISNSVIIFIFCAVSTLVTLIPCLMSWTPMVWSQVVLLLVAGASCAAAQYALTAAYQYAAPRDISVYDCSQILFSGMMGFLLFQQIPSFASIIAYLLIILASVILFLHYRQNAQTQVCKDSESAIHNTVVKGNRSLK